MAEDPLPFLKTLLLLPLQNLSLCPLQLAVPLLLLFFTLSLFLHVLAVEVQQFLLVCQPPMIVLLRIANRYGSEGLHCFALQYAIRQSFINTLLILPGDVL